MVQMRMYGFKKVKPTDSMERVIEKEDSNSSASADYTETHLSRLYHPAFYRELISQILNSSIFQVGIVGMVLLDALLVISELLASLNALEVNRHTMVPRILRFICIAILALFLVEFLVKLTTMRMVYLRNWMEVFDTLVVIVTFASSLVFLNSNGYHSSIGLLVLLRLWRIIKIIKDVINSVKIQAGKKLNHERQTREVVEHELEKFREYCAAQERRIAELKTLLCKHGIAMQAVKPYAGGETIRVLAEVSNAAES